MRLRPLGAYMLVEVELDEFTTAAGLLIGHADIERPPYLTGRVVAVGPGRWSRRDERIPIPWEPGDRVVFARGRGWPLPGDPGEPERVILRDDPNGDPMVVYAKIDTDKRLDVRHGKNTRSTASRL